MDMASAMILEFAQISKGQLQVADPTFGHHKKVEHLVGL
jgi:hypothetical protein